MGSPERRLYGIAGAALILLLGLWACESEQQVTDISANTVTCEGCHNDQAALQKLTPETDDDGHGGGG